MQLRLLPILPVLLMMTLVGCGPSGTSKPELPVIPKVSSEIIECLKREVPPPHEGSLSKKELMILIGEFRKNDLAKKRCGIRLVNQTNDTIDAIEAYLRSLP